VFIVKSERSNVTGLFKVNAVQAEKLRYRFNPLNAKLNHICHLLAVAGATILSTLAG
jgi:hypothetical protein